MAEKRSPLSQRELDVLQQIARGMENQQIAEILGVSTETVRTHIKKLLVRLDAINRTHAVAIAYHTGLFATAHRCPVRSTST